MEATELLEIIARGEDGKHQFKANITNASGLAAEMVAFSNSGGGRIFIGVNDNGQIAGLSRADMGRLNQLVSNAASQSVYPPINPQTENVALFTDELVMVVSISDGISKPYMDNSGAIWVKSGADKRKVTSREEMQRIFQNTGLLHADEMPVDGLSMADVDLDYFKAFFLKAFGEDLYQQEAPFTTLLENMNLMKNGVLNLSGTLLFTRSPQFKLPAFVVKAVSYPGIDIHASVYRDSQDIAGRLEDVFNQTMSFLTRNLHHVQMGQSVNSQGELEIPLIALEELLVNALIHRDYFISSPVRVFVFDDRIEIISPGHLPNNLTLENIKTGNSNIRNPILASFATRILPYRGLGNGVRRALREYPYIEFNDDREGNQFIVTIRRISRNVNLLE
ncbi:MAG: putative DNA binding domain-containing protein [Syntrophomonadaceae bacterium]|nr:putative DNA binding domain-containing protein [Syntrophomonadaceae bacterium]